MRDELANPSPRHCPGARGVGRAARRDARIEPRVHTDPAPTALVRETAAPPPHATDVHGAASLAVHNGPIAGSGASVESASTLAGIVGYVLPTASRRWSTELVLGVPFTVKFRATGTLANESLAPMALGIPTGVGPLGPDLGEAQAVPIVVTANYRVIENRYVVPYLGLGPSVLFARNTKVTNRTLNEVNHPELSIDPAPGLVLQGGLDARITRSIYARIDVKFIAFMLARAEVAHVNVKTPGLPLFDSVEVGTAKMSVWVNPVHHPGRPRRRLRPLVAPAPTTPARAICPIFARGPRRGVADAPHRRGTPAQLTGKLRSHARGFRRGGGATDRSGMLATMRFLLPVSVCVVFAAACGDDHHSAGPPADAGIDAPADAPIDDPPEQTTTLTADDGVDPVTDWSFDDTSVGARAGVTLFVNNAGAAVTQALTASIVGDGFAIDSAGSTCSGTRLVPNARCSVAVLFAPTTTGTFTAKLHVTGGNGALDFTLGGTAVAAPAGIVADAGTLNFGVVEIGTDASATVQVSNPGTAAVTLSARAVTTGFTSDDNCPATLSGGAACTIHVRLRPTRNGIITGTLTVPSSANTLTIRLRAVGARQIQLIRAGAGAGLIASVPAGISCGTVCSGLFTGRVVLIATPDPGNFFTAWGPPCGTDKICVLADTTDNLILTPAFQPPTAKRIDVTFAGAAAGFAYIVDAADNVPIINCTASCSTYVAPGDSVTVFGYTPSTFSGWTGNCTTSTHDCNLGNVIADRAATVTFDRDDRELTTLFPRATVTGLTTMPGGDLVIADALGVTRMTLTGTQVWTHAFDGGARDLASDAAGHIYGGAGGGAGRGAIAGLFALNPDGTLLWTKPVAVGHNRQQSIQSTVSASPDGTVIAALALGSVQVVDGNGDVRFTPPETDVDGMAVAPDGTVAVGVSGQPEQLDIHRFTASGTPLTTLSPLPGESDASLVYDAQSFLCGQTTTFGTQTVVRFSPDLALAFSHAEPTHLQPSPPAATVITSTGEVVAVRGNDDLRASGLHIEAFSPTGAVTWTHIKPAVDQFPVFFVLDGINFTAAATDSDHHLAIAGDYNDFTPVIQVYTMP